jgi:hypothetical protein
MPSDLPAPRFSLDALRGAILGGMWGGTGCGEPCDYCRLPIEAPDVEYEVAARVDAEQVSLRFHMRCFDAWVAARKPEP